MQQLLLLQLKQQQHLSRSRYQQWLRSELLSFPFFLPHVLSVSVFFREEKVTSREQLAPFLAFTAREADTASCSKRRADGIFLIHLFVKYKTNTKLSNDRSTFKFHSTRKQLQIEIVRRKGNYIFHKRKMRMRRPDHCSLDTVPRSRHGASRG